MIRSVLALAFVAGFIASPALADKSDCSTKYNEFWEKTQRYSNAKPSTDDLVATQRMALRAYDACQAGDESNFANFWENMRKYGNAQDDARRFWTEMQRNGSARQ